MQRSTERILTTHTGSLGFGTFARSHFQVEPEIVWAKLRAMAESAQLASAHLWG